jgi:hypothetical protein
VTYEGLGDLRSLVRVYDAIPEALEIWVTAVVATRHRIDHVTNTLVIALFPLIRNIREFGARVHQELWRQRAEPLAPAPSISAGLHDPQVPVGIQQSPSDFLDPACNLLITRAVDPESFSPRKRCTIGAGNIGSSRKKGSHSSMCSATQRALTPGNTRQFPGSLQGPSRIWKSSVSQLDSSSSAPLKWVPKL